MHRLVLLVLIPLLFSCRSNQSTDTNQGIITYKIGYSEKIKSKTFGAFLPTTMVTTYKKGDYKLDIKGELSLYSLEYISHLNGDSSATLFRIFDKRMFHKHGKGEFLFLFQEHQESSLEFLDDEIKTIAGIDCKKVMVHFSNPDIESISVYYTEEIDFKRPKENSPFDDIPGMLMAFGLNFKGLRLNFEAQTVDYKKVDDKTFAIPEEYSPSDHGEISDLVSTLIQ